VALVARQGYEKERLSRIGRLSDRTIAKMTKGEMVAMEVIVRICNALDCTSNDIVEVMPNKRDKQ
jgi:DNA-binding Xre family transcriptional regulator